MHAIDAREQRNAFGAALFIHGLLAAGLLVSLSWGQKPQPVVQVELWGSPPANLPNPTSEQPVKAPVPKPTPAPAPEQKADISLQKKREAEDKAERAKVAEKKLAEEKAAQKKLQEQRAAQQREALRNAELARLLGSETKAKANDRGKDIATKAGASEGAEIGAKTGVDPKYSDLVGAKIKNQINFNPGTIRGNPRVDFIIEQLPSGEVIKVTKVKSSGVLAWDSAVERAIWAASPLPKPVNGAVPRILDYSAEPNEIR